MPRKPKFAFRKTPSGWKVEIPASLSPSGKRERAFFKTRDLARDYAEELTEQHKELGKNSLTIKPSLAEAALRAEQILAPTGASLIEAAQSFRNQWDAQQASVPFGEAVKDYLCTRSDLRDSTLTSYKYTLEKVFEPLNPKTLSDITTANFSALLADKGATATRMHRANLGAFWRWAAKSPRNWCQSSIFEALETVRVSNDADIKILKADDVKALLQSAEIESPAAAAAYAIAVFGGVRMGELEKLSWGDVGEEHIEIGKEIAKKHSRRLIPICPSLKAWLDACRGDAGNDTLVVPGNWSDVSKSVRRRAGWDVVARLLADPPKQTRGPWPANACRHTCASVQVAIGTSLEDLTFKFGHSGGHDLLRRHYVSRMTKKEAFEILAIGPHNSKVKLLATA